MPFAEQARKLDLQELTSMIVVSRFFKFTEIPNPSVLSRLVELPMQVEGTVVLQVDSAGGVVLQAAAVVLQVVQAVVVVVVLQRPQQIQFCLLVSVIFSCSRVTQWAMAHFGNRR